MGTSAIQIDPNTGERITATMIDPATGERIATLQKGYLDSFNDAVGVTALTNMRDALPNALAHSFDAGRNPIEDAKAAAYSKFQQLRAIKTRQDAVNAIPIVGPAFQMMQQQHDAGNTAGMLGTMAGTVVGLAGPKAVEGLDVAGATAKAAELAPKAGELLEGLGDSTQNFAVKRINKTVGLLQADFDHGATAGKQYLDQGFGMSRSMDAIATKADNAIIDVGKRLSDAYERASANMPEQPVGNYNQPQLGTGDKNALPGGVAKARIPVQKVFDAITPALKEAHDLATGFGGGGAPASLNTYMQNLAPELDAAVQRGGFTPKELFDLKQKLSKNINWKSTSDDVQNLNNIREKQYGAITGLLNEAVPELQPLNKAYQDLQVLKKRAQLRAKTGSTPLTNFKEQGLFATGGAALGSAVLGPGAGTVVGGLAGLAADSLPSKTGIAQTLYNGGKGLSAAGRKLQDYLGRAR